MVIPLNTATNFQNENYKAEFDNGTAIGMPPINYNSRRITPLTNTNNLNSYDPNYNPVKRYNKNLAPSSGVLTEAFLKSRVLFTPLYMHNEASTRYEMISKIYYSSDDIKTNLLKVA
ncbi:MAG: hypothetical protein ACJ0GH_01390 [Alphaproteobacteria bacterium]|tara:strand:- start:202 stop:552 length:351 start_codon:yes stop_codon:yes gene_type:complete